MDPHGDYGYRVRSTVVPAPRPPATTTRICGELPLEPAPVARTAHDSDDHREWAPAAATYVDDHALSTTHGADEQAPAAATGERTLQRTKVTLTPPKSREQPARVYIAPPPDGLSKFDLGTVPASVTPPRTWRKAAWFATVSSGSVVVALLVAGSYLVSAPPTEQSAIEGWTGLRGNQPELHDEGFAAPSISSAVPTTDGTTTSAAPTKETIADLAGVRSSDHAATQRSATTSTRADAPTSSAPPTTTQVPSKPPPEPATRETETAQFYQFPPSAKTMGDRSEIFFNEITENPEKAHEQTGGDLHDEGAEGIAARYADIAYFEVEHIYIDQKRRMTINTVTVVYKDGSTRSEQRTLRFEQGDKITHD